jgi:hypothetical protein
MASIYILFPKEHRDLVPSATQHFQWAVERFEAMSGRNALARAALGVLQAIYIRLRRSLGTAQNTARARSPPPLTAATSDVAGAGAGAQDNPSPHQSDGLANGSTSTGSTAVFTPATSDMYSASSAPSIDAAAQQQGFDWSVPSDFDWSTIQPIFATGDLVYNDLVGVRDDGSIPQWAADTPLMDEIGSQPWQFDGDFGNDSVWNLLNQYTPF